MIALLCGHRRIVFSSPTYVLVFLGAVLLLVGGQWLAHLLGTTRNLSDRVGHVLQGMIPAGMAQDVAAQNRDPLASGCMCRFVWSHDHQRRI
jgi:uncharacterized membrane protein YjdF